MKKGDGNILIENQKIETVVHQNRILNYYKEKGYECSLHNKFEIDVDDIWYKSDDNVKVECDYCGKVNTISYRRYYKDVVNGNIKKYACKKCSNLKQVESVGKTYGVKSTSQIKEVRAKQKATCLKKYGVLHPTENKDIMAKMKRNNFEKYGIEWACMSDEANKKRISTNLKRYGCKYASSSKQTQSKRKNTFRKKYGCDNPYQNSEIKEKIKETCLARYGVENAMKSDLIISKVRTSLYNNRTCTSSKEQLKLCGLLDGELNYPLERYSIDIFLPSENIAIEYDGGGHKNSVVFGEEESVFISRESLKNEVIKKHGYKLIRILNPLDKQYKDSEYLKAINKCKTVLEFNFGVSYNINTDNMKIIE